MKDQVIKKLEEMNKVKDKQIRDLSILSKQKENCIAELNSTSGSIYILEILLKEDNDAKTSPPEAPAKP